MSRIISALLFLILLVTDGCGVGAPKKAIFDLVEEHYDQICAACRAEDTQALTAMDGVTSVHITEGYVIVYCRGAGIAPSSQDYGFYYSEENSPVTINCNQRIECRADGLTAEGDGYQCVVSGNTFYTEHIKGNIYFYSNAY